MVYIKNKDYRPFPTIKELEYHVSFLVSEVWGSILALGAHFSLLCGKRRSKKYMTQKPLAGEFRKI